MRYAPRALLAGGLGFAVSCLAACGGGSGLLSSEQANNLNSQLNQLSAAVSSHHCPAASQARGNLQTLVANLPSSVDATLRGDLSQGVSTVGTLAIEQCAQTQTNTTSTSTTTTTTSTTSSSPTTTTSSTPTTTTSSTPTTTTSSTPTTTTASTPTTTTPSGGGGLGGGGGGGGGASGGSGG